MRMRVALAAALLLALSLLTGGTALATDDTDQHNDQALYFLSQLAEEKATFGEEQPQPGDQVFFEEVVFESNADMDKGQRVGRVIGIVNFTVTGALVDVGVSFDDGADQLFYKGAFFLEDLPVRTFDLAVVGGTGQFEGATGAATLTELNGTTTFVEVRLDD
ncbi:MAG: dirigent protein [Actinomycetota bacterium]|nr:dirigent protein [Actinomycetota bacterium]